MKRVQWNLTMIRHKLNESLAQKIENGSRRWVMPSVGRDGFGAEGRARWVMNINNKKGRWQVGSARSFSEKTIWG